MALLTTKQAMAAPDSGKIDKKNYDLEVKRRQVIFVGWIKRQIFQSMATAEITEKSKFELTQVGRKFRREY